MATYRAHLPALSRRRVLHGGLTLGAAFTAAPLLSACGPQAGGELDPEAEPDLDGVGLRVLVNQPNLGAFTILAEEFEDQTGASVELTPFPYDQLTSQATLDVQSGAGEFDVFQYWYAGLGDLADGGVLEDLTDWIGAQPGIDPQDYLESIYDTYTLFEQRRWGLPFDGDTFLLFYNRRLFDEYGVEPPTTWDDYNEITEKITNDSGGDVYGAVVMGEQVPVILGSTFADRLVGFGGTFLGGDGRPTLNTPEAIAAAQSLFDVAPHALPSPLQTGFDEAIPAFLSGQAAMIEFWTDMSVMASDPDQSEIIDDWAAAELPVGGSNTVHGTSLNAGFAVGVSTASEQKEAAAAFVKFVSAPEPQRRVVGEFGTGSDPVRESTLESEEFRDTFGDAADAVAEGLRGDPLAWPNGVGAVTDLQTLVDELALGLQGEQSAEETLANVQQVWEGG